MKLSRDKSPFVIYAPVRLGHIENRGTKKLRVSSCSGDAKHMANNRLEHFQASQC